MSKVSLRRHEIGFRRVLFALALGLCAVLNLRAERLPLRLYSSAGVLAINETPDGSVWFGCETGVLRLLPDGRRLLYPIKKATSYDETRSVVADERGRMRVAHRSGVFVFEPETLDALAGVPDSTVREVALEEKSLKTLAQLPCPMLPAKCCGCGSLRLKTTNQPFRPAAFRRVTGFLKLSTDKSGFRRRAVCSFMTGASCGA